ncbi:MAG: HAMP domain-containing sensor histidine kinase [Acidimicrobiia bacterium]|nr:HAMP domain-containing sensor histidine kinase [Acidimicrobiia bacterium]MDX2467887.1 HAMP domain-containing sensor histidine kinase [Acidimicrobiia bacterium]
MRRQLILVVGAVTAMVVIAFLLPLSLMVRDLAADRAVTSGQNEAEAIAQLIATRIPDSDPQTVIDSTQLDNRIYATSIILASDDGATREVFGAEVPQGENLEAALSGVSFRASVPGGQAIYSPILLPNTGQAIVVRVFVTDVSLPEGVSRSTTTLGLLGLALVAIAIAVTDRLGQSMLQPVRDLSATASVLGKGNLDARVTPSGPPEVQEVALELNDLADRIVRLLRMEREAAADLSHRLRTPLTAVRLDAEALEDGLGAQRLLDDLDELERTVDFVIREARRPGRTDTAEACDIAAVAADRVQFWTALADEQVRNLEYMTDGEVAMVALGADDATTMIDALVGNVFAHTDEGVDFTVAVAAVTADEVMIIVDDQGPGFGAEMAERGLSAGGSTGLGLDIATRTADSAGGRLTIGTSGTGGGRVTVTLPRQLS